jgi:hypothetical protein
MGSGRAGAGGAGDASSFLANLQRFDAFPKVHTNLLTPRGLSRHPIPTLRLALRRFVLRLLRNFRRDLAARLTAGGDAADTART